MWGRLTLHDAIDRLAEHLGLDPSDLSEDLELPPRYNVARTGGEPPGQRPPHRPRRRRAGRGAPAANQRGVDDGAIGLAHDPNTQELARLRVESSQLGQLVLRERPAFRIDARRGPGIDWA